MLEMSDSVRSKLGFRKLGFRKPGFRNAGFRNPGFREVGFRKPGFRKLGCACGYIWNHFNDDIGETSERRSGAYVGFLERANTICK